MRSNESDPLTPNCPPARWSRRFGSRSSKASAATFLLWPICTHSTKKLAPFAGSSTRRLAVDGLRERPCRVVNRDATATRNRAVRKHDAPRVATGSHDDDQHLTT